MHQNLIIRHFEVTENSLAAQDRKSDNRNAFDIDL